ncbi:MAG: TetR/AcrR family transcriptional regulator [Propioniciclava sp.]
MDHSTLLHHFGTKNALLVAVLGWHDEEQYRRWQVGNPGTVPLDLDTEDLIAGFVETARRNAEAPGLVRLLSTLSAEAGHDGHPARTFLQHRHELLTRVLTRAIDQARGRGVTSDLNAADEAALIIGTWEGLQVYDALHPGQIDVPALLERTLQAALTPTQ